MDLVLINPNAGGQGVNEATVLPPLGLAYIAAVLESHQFQCKIIDANVLKLTDEQTLAEIPADSKMIGLYLNSFSYRSCQILAEKIRKARKNSLVIIGGPLCSAGESTQLLKEIDCHGLIRGEGEYAVLAIANNLRNHQPPFSGRVSGLNYLDSADQVISFPAERINKLDELPFPAYHLLPPLAVYKTRSRQRPVAALITSRGCPFQCSFCSKDIFKRIVTFRSAQNVLAEIDFLVKKYGVRQIDILDDNFSLNKPRLMEILDGLIKRNYGLALNFQTGIRAENVDEEVLIKMKQAGVYKLAFGVESADENVLKLHKKMLDLKKIEQVVKLAKKMGFVVYGFFIIGLWGETDEAFARTLAFAKKLNFDIATFCMAVPFVNTELYRLVKEQGRLLIETSRNIDAGFFGGQVFYEYEGSTKEDILRRYKKAYKEFYSFKKQLKILLTIRSLSELAWVKDAALSVVKGLLKKHEK